MLRAQAVPTAVGVRMGVAVPSSQSPQLVMGTMTQARSRRYRVALQGQLWGHSFKHLFPPAPPRAEKEGDRQTEQGDRGMG